MWSINGALALWLGYWIFVIWVVWSYEKRCRKLEGENRQLRKLAGIREPKFDEKTGDSRSGGGHFSRKFVVREDTLEDGYSVDGGTSGRSEKGSWKSSERMAKRAPEVRKSGRNFGVKDSGDKHM